MSVHVCIISFVVVLKTDFSKLLRISEMSARENGELNLQRVSNQRQEENREVKESVQPQESESPGRGCLGVKMTQEQGGHCEYFMDLLMLSP